MGTFHIIIIEYAVCIFTGGGKILYGLEIGISTMRVKEKSRFLLRADYAFGEKGCPPRIPENATCE